GLGTLMISGVERAFRFVHVGNPQVTIEFSTSEEVEALDLPSIGPAIETDARFPNRTNVSFWAREGAGIRARIFERGVGETMSSGTGSSGAAVAAHLAGAGDSLDVRLDGGTLNVNIGAGLELDLTGWAIPVYAAVLAPETVEELS
ncbi:MAG: diaminopimelate epimerase, partial [Actinomycetes bacterium]